MFAQYWHASESWLRGENMGFEIKRKSRRANEPRDPAGRFQEGHSGNPNGRPKKQRELPGSFREIIAKLLFETVVVLGPNGKTRKMIRHEQLIHELLADVRSASTKERLALLLKLDSLGVTELIHAELEEPFEDVFTEEDRRIIAVLTDDR